MFGAGVDAEDFGLGGFDGGDAGALGAGVFDDVAEVVFALGVVVFDGAEPGEHGGGSGAQDARVAQADGAFGGGGVLVFDDAFDIAVLGDDAAVAGGVGGAHGEEGEADVALLAAGEHAAQGVGGDEGVVGVEDGDFAIAEMGGGLQGRVGGAEAVMLHDAGPGGGLLADEGGFGPDHDDDALEDCGATVDQMAEHGFARDFVQGFREIGFHAGAEPGGEDDGGGAHGLSCAAVLLSHFVLSRDPRRRCFHLWRSRSSYARLC